jgi:hypothetical protein
VTDYLGAILSSLTFFLMFDFGSLKDLMLGIMFPYFHFGKYIVTLLKMTELNLIILSQKRIFFLHINGRSEGSSGLRQRRIKGLRWYHQSFLSSYCLCLALSLYMCLFVCLRLSLCEYLCCPSPSGSTLSSPL